MEPRRSEALQCGLADLDTEPGQVAARGSKAVAQDERRSFAKLRGQGIGILVNLEIVGIGQREQELQGRRRAHAGRVVLRGDLQVAAFARTRRSCAPR
jgi:hypothetical protein